MVKYSANQGVGLMKKIIAVLLYTFMFMFTGFTTTTESYAITGNNNKEIVEKTNNTVKTENTENKEPEVIEEKHEEVENTEYVETSITEEYVEESPIVETYHVNYGTYGRLYFYSHSVALYDYNVNTNSSNSLQGIVNDEDSAAYYRNKGKLVIADHNYQGFSILGDLNDGDTSYIEFEDGSIIRYRLIKKSKGYNTGPDLVDTEGNSFFSMESDIIMYTCYDDGIMVTLWVLS